MKTRGKVVVFGAGATGRGHVGLLCWQAGYHIVFVDRNAVLVDDLRKKGRYRVHLFGGEKPPEEYKEITVDGFDIFHSEQRAEIVSEIMSADLVLTAVFDQNLPDVAVTLALAVAASENAGRQSQLNIIACENMMDSSSTLGDHVKNELPAELHAFVDSQIGFPDCMISRVVPRPDADPFTIITEDYNEWTVRKEAFKGEKPDGLDFIELVENQTARLERKLFIHNGGHAVTGYVGYHRGCRYIHQAVADPIVANAAVGALDELGEIIRQKHGFSPENIDDYKKSFVKRGSIAMMKDEISRVVRDPIRKLSPRERLLAPAIWAVDHNLPRKWIVNGIVSALKYNDPADEQSTILAGKIEHNGLTKTLQEVCSLPNRSPLIDEILEKWDTWA